MANKALFSSSHGAQLPAATAINHEGAPAYALEPKHALAQYAATGCLSNTFYAGAGEQLNTVLSLAGTGRHVYCQDGDLCADQRVDEGRAGTASGDFVVQEPGLVEGGVPARRG
jgi:hypothetical protein